MDGMTLKVVEQVCEELPQEEIVELSPTDLGGVGAGMCDPGSLDIEK